MKPSFLMSTILLAGLLLQTGCTQWDDAKLRLFRFTGIFHDQDKELRDIEEKGLDPSKYSRIDLEDLKDGGPPKDGIPSIDEPRFHTAWGTPFPGTETVIGVVINGEAKAYPYGILNWHEIVNDVIGGVPIAVTYCPLCDTIVAIERGDTTFGVSGKLFQSCLVMFDRAEDTLYLQPWAEGIVGEAFNTVLDRVPAVKTTLTEWRKQYPDTLVLSPETGHSRDYFRYPYGSYRTNDRLIFPVRNQDQLEGHPKDIISYIWEADDEAPHNLFSGRQAAVTHDEVRKQGEMRIAFGDETVTAFWDDTLSTTVFVDGDEEVIPSSTAFRFVYPAFFPLAN